MYKKAWRKVVVLTNETYYIFGALFALTVCVA